VWKPVGPQYEPYRLFALIHRLLAVRIVTRLLGDPRLMATWLCGLVSDVRARLRPDDEGSLWLLFLDQVQGEVIVATAFDSTVDPSNFEVTRGLRRIISEVPSPAVLLVVPRADGLPLAVDKELWSELNAAPTPGTEFVDLLVVGAETYWSASHPV
jgi:hypothetical protein